MFFPALSNANFKLKKFSDRGYQEKSVDLAVLEAVNDGNTL